MSMTVKHGFLLRLNDFGTSFLFFSKNIILLIFFAIRYVTLRSKPIYGLDKSFLSIFFYITILHFCLFNMLLCLCFD